MVRIGHHYHILGRGKEAAASYREGLLLSDPFDAWVLIYLPEIFPIGLDGGVMNGAQIVTGLDSGDEEKRAAALQSYSDQLDEWGLDEKAEGVRHEGRSSGKR